MRFSAALPDNAAIADLFAMTPYYYRTSAADRAKLDALSALTVTADCALLVYERE